MDSDAWRLRTQLKAIAGVSFVAISDQSEWAGTDDFAARISFGADRTATILHLSESSPSTHPGRLIVEEIGRLKIKCLTDKSAHETIFMQGVDVLSPGNATLAHLQIRSISDLAGSYPALLNELEAWTERPTPVAMHGVVWSCTAKKTLSP